MLKDRLVRRRRPRVPCLALCMLMGMCIKRTRADVSDWMLPGNYTPVTRKLIKKIIVCGRMAFFICGK